MSSTGSSSSGYSRRQGQQEPPGRWAALHKGYAERKRAKFGRKKILQLTGAMKTRFTSANNPFYVQRYLGSSAHRGTFQFGARSSVAAAHRKGNPALAGAAPKGSKARTIFGGIAKRLPVRDMVSKTLAQRDEFQRRLETWYRKERVPQVLRANAALLRNSKPGRS